MKYLVIFLVLIGFVGLIQMSYAEEMLMFLENNVRKIYYTGENINSAFFDHDSASIIFELGENATLTLKIPQVYKTSGDLFVLVNGEEVAQNITIDDCFYYTSFETKTPERLEIIFAHWAEAPERTDNCETFVISPLKQVKIGVTIDKIQCREDLVLVLKKSKEFYACVKPDTISKLFERNWALNEVTIIDTDTTKQDSKIIKIIGVVERWTTPEGWEYHLIPLEQELPRIEYTGYNTLNLFATKDTIHHFLRNLDGKLIKIEGSFLFDNGKYFTHYSGFPTIPVKKLDVISDAENLKYSIEGARLLSVTKIPDFNGLNIVLQETQNGSIQITIPRDLLDAKIGNNDDSFIVLIDGYEVAFTEITTDFERTLTISFEEGARTIQVIATVPT